MRRAKSADEPLDREEVVNLRVAKELEGVRKGQIVHDRVLAMQVNAIDCVDSIGDYLIKLSQAGFLRAKGLAGRYEKVK